MLTVASASTPLAEHRADLLAVAAFAPEAAEDRPADAPLEPPVLTEGAAALGDTLGIDLAAELVAVGFDASPGSSVRVPTRGAVPAPAVLVVGLGPRSKATFDHLRRAAAAAAQAASRSDAVATDLHLALGGDQTLATEAVTEGLLLGAYRYTDFKSDVPVATLADATLHGGDPDIVDAAVAAATVTATAVAFARDLVNTPPQAKRPPALADRVVAAVDGTRVAARVLDEAALADGGYGGLLGVGQGSTEPPRLVELTYEPDGWAAGGRHVALVGKGITFDTGGLSLKPSASMETMKMDMAGAATVAGVVTAAAAMELPVKVTGLLALAENMPSGTATRVSDVLTIRGGTTVEVLNTDAEGRLVLADALVHACELEPDAVIDVATLTGAAIIALGDRIGIVMANDDDLADAIVDAGARIGEPFWRLPMGEEQYGEELEGDVADLRNIGGRGAGTIRAGLFLSRFVDERPWAHLDIAGIAWTESAAGYRTKGATGSPVRTLLAWLRDA
ncbi:MAG: leucyl aminopeptidase [Nitriliruptor sp.]|uniref:leucyl aminopeptidase n=1 Tax=Nitriliruptor sp. TaxID=2448056 RepID=UPI0034A0864F